MASTVVKRLLPAAIALATLASTAYTLTLLDQVVNIELYYYGLKFDYGWANPYWILLRATLVLLAVCAVATTFNTILILRLGFGEKQRNLKISPSQKVMKNIPVATQTDARTSTTPSPPPPQSLQQPTPKPAPISAPAPSYKGPDVPGLFRCTHCGKVFTQPLRMLDFQKDPPRTVNVCPFCNETLLSATVR